MRSPTVFVLFSMAVMAVPVALAWDIADATAECYTVQNRRNQKDLYADSGDCHNFIQCFYNGDGTASGTTQACQTGLFWHEPVLACMPEGDTPCTDACLDDATSATGFYAGTGCRQFFKCSNTGSYGMCCPELTRFNDMTGGCDFDDTCLDPCEPVAPAMPTSTIPPEELNATVCRDSFGSLVASDASEDNAFYLVDYDGQPSTKLYCPAGYAFDLTSCRCDMLNGDMIPPFTPDRSAALYLAFDDGESGDSSKNAFEVELLGDAALDSDSQFGNGALLVTNGRIEVPAFKNFDFRSDATFACWFKCAAACTGGVFSNRRVDDTEDYTINVEASGTTMNGNLNFWSPTGAQPITATIPSSGWTHIAITYNGNDITTYIDGVASTPDNIAGYLFTSQAPFTIGADQVFGNFSGHIDEFVITTFAMTATEVGYLHAGDLASLTLF